MFTYRDTFVCLLFMVDYSFIDCVAAFIHERPRATGFFFESKKAGNATPLTRLWYISV
jgi:hypothetical protein